MQPVGLANTRISTSYYALKISSITGFNHDSDPNTCKSIGRRSQVRCSFEGVVYIIQEQGHDVMRKSKHSQVSIVPTAQEEPAVSYR